MDKGFQAATTIARPIETVWSVMTDFTRAPEWMPGVEAVAPRDDTPLGTGKIFETELSTGGRGRKREMTLAQWDPKNHAFALASSEGSVDALYRYSLSASGSETRVELQARCTSGSSFMTLLSPLIRYMMAKHDSRQMPLLKAAVERRSP